MNNPLFNASFIAETGLALVLLALLVSRRQVRIFSVYALFLGFRAFYEFVLLLLLTTANHGIEPHLAYKLYFYIYWVSFAVESLLGLALIQSIFNLAIAPLDGIRRLGTLVFRWAACISGAIALGSALTLKLSTRSLIIPFMRELQRTQSILMLCLLLFVCFAVRPMGLTYRSRIFGVSLGLGILAASNLVASAWMEHFRRMYSAIDTMEGIASCAVMLLWILYFALPEPKRRLIVLPTTSPFLRWNQIAQVLGDHSGYVAIAGVPPELFAPAELEVMRRASAKMASQPMAKVHQPQTA